MNDAMTILWACKGPGAGKLMEENAHTADVNAVVLAGLLAISITTYGLLRFWGIFPLVCVGLMAIHPAWTIPVNMGDCGFLKANGAIAFTLLAIILVVSQITFGWPTLAEKLHSLWSYESPDDLP